MVDDQLASSAEQIGQRLFSAGAIEDVFLLHFFPRQFAALAAELIAQTGELLLSCQQLLARREPLGSEHHFRECRLLLVMLS